MTTSTELLKPAITTAFELYVYAAIRERFAQYAKHNGHIKIADYAVTGTNYSVHREVWHEIGGRKLKALLIVDGFDSARLDQNRGTRSGTRLYLTEFGEWLQITRTGAWTEWQGAANYWGCGVSAAPYADEYADAGCEDEYMPDSERQLGGGVEIVSDHQVSERYELATILGQLGAGMAELIKKLPARYNKLKARAELAAQYCR